jgi:hypothetical protein
VRRYLLICIPMHAAGRVGLVASLADVVAAVLG